MKARRSLDSGPADLLLRCLSARVEPAFSNQVGRYSPNGWNEVVDMAARQGLAPLLFKRLKERDARAHVPTDAWERLRLAYFANARRNTRLYRELRTVLRCLRGSGIRVIVLKGAFLAEAVYGEVALRAMYDVDLLVPMAELSRVQAILLDLGYGPQEREEIESICRRRKHLEEFHKDGMTTEIHWTIVSPTGPFTIDAAGFWERAHPATTAGVEVLALSPEDLLLHLCLHFCYSDSLTALRPFCDIAETIHRYGGEIDWAQVVRLAREWGAARYAGLTLHLVRSMLRTEVPGDVLEQLVPGGLDERILDTARQFVLAPTRLRQWMPFFDPVIAGSTRDKAKLFRKRIFLSRDEMAATYPTSRDSKHLWFYYALRLRDVIRAFVSHNLRRGLPVIRSRGQNRNVSLVNWLRSGRS